MSSLDSLLRRQPPTAWERFRSSPLLFLTRLIYHNADSPQEPTTIATSDPYTDTTTLRVVCISDTHSTHATQPPLPEGDILIHAGDLTHSGTTSELADALTWLSAQPHEHKLFVAGNHDAALADPVQRAHLVEAHPDLVYLEDDSIELDVRGRTLRVYGSPHTPKHGSWPFQYPRVRTVDAATDVWAAVPTVTDVLITHGPPFAHLDLDGAGCLALLAAVWRIRPRLHVFGHIHGARGVEHVHWTRAQMAYEDLCARRSGWAGLIRLLWWVIMQRLRHVRQKLGARHPALADGSIMVNAAAVGGVRDEHRRGAIVVHI